MPGLIAVLKSPITWTLLAVALLGALAYKYGENRYTAGYDKAVAGYNQKAAESNVKVVNVLATAQTETKANIDEDLKIARDGQIAANQRADELQRKLGELQNVKENDCTRVSADTFRLLNAGACAYNLKHGAGGSRTECKN